jgi:hypothetical protein
MNQNTFICCSCLFETGLMKGEMAGAQTGAAHRHRAGNAASVNRDGHVARQIGKTLIQHTRPREAASDRTVERYALPLGPTQPACWRVWQRD